MSDRKQRQTLKEYCIQNDRLELLCQWHPTLNGALTPEMVTAGSTKSVWWQCPEGHVWRAVIYSRTGGNRCGCPVCAGRVQERRGERYAAMLLRDQRGDTPAI